MVRQTPSKMQKGTPQILPNTSDQLLHCNKAILQLFTITTWRLPLHGHIWSIIPGIYNWHTFTCMRRMRAGTCLQHTHREYRIMCRCMCVCTYAHAQIYVYIYYIYVCVWLYIYIHSYHQKTLWTSQYSIFPAQKANCFGHAAGTTPCRPAETITVR